MAGVDTATISDHRLQESKEEITCADSMSRVDARQAPLLRPAVFNPQSKLSDTPKAQMSAEGNAESSLPVQAKDKRSSDATSVIARAGTPAKKKKRKKRSLKGQKEEQGAVIPEVKTSEASTTRASAFSVVGGAPQPMLPTIPSGIPIMPTTVFARTPLFTASTRLVMNSALHPPIFSVAANPHLTPAMQSQYLPGLPVGAYTPGLVHPAAAALLRLPYSPFPMATLSEAAIRAATAAVVTPGIAGMPSLNLPSAKQEQQADSGFFSDHSSTSTPTAVSTSTQHPKLPTGEPVTRKGKRKAKELEPEESESPPSSPKLLIDSTAEIPTTEIKQGRSTKKQMTENDVGTCEEDKQQAGMTDTAKALLFCATECHLAVLQDDEGDTPLHLAIAQGNLPLTSYLVALLTGAKMNLDIFNYIKQTPLHLAVITQQHAVIVMLVKGGANANLPDRFGRTAMHLAVESQDIGSLQALTHATNPRLDLEIRNFDGFTALHGSVIKGSIAMAQFLISIGANVNTPDGKSGMTALHHAVESKSIEMIQLLIRKGASVNSTTFGGGTALHLASGYALLDAIKILLASGANSKVSNVEGDTPADVAPTSRLSQMLRSGDRRKGATS